MLRILSSFQLEHKQTPPPKKKKNQKIKHKLKHRTQQGRNLVQRVAFKGLRRRQRSMWEKKIQLVVCPAIFHIHLGGLSLFLFSFVLKNDGENNNAFIIL